MTVLEWASRHQFLALGGLAATAPVIVYAIGLLKKAGESALRMVWDLVLVRKELMDNPTIDIVANYLSRWQGVDFGRTGYRLSPSYISTIEARRTVAYRSTSRASRVLMFGRVPLFLLPATREESPCICFIRWTINWDKFLCEAAKAWDDNLREDHFGVKSHVGRTKGLEDSLKPASCGSSPMPDEAICSNNEDPLNYRKEDLAPPRRKSLLEEMSLSPEMELVIRRIRFWYSHRAWYQKKRIPWKYGCLLYGPPGTGKTSLVRALAGDLGIPIHTFHLASMDDYDFLDAWKRAKRDNVRIVLWEDMDTVFEGRTNRIPGSKLSYTTLLNAIDGIEEEDGLIFIVTTNNINSIDEALGKPRYETNGGKCDGKSTRPGRIDLVVELRDLDYAGRLKMARRILEDEELAQKFAAEGENDTGAQFQDKCRSEAERRLWENAE